jgi:hypothetical protein
MKFVKIAVAAAVALAMSGSAVAQSGGMSYRAIYYNDSQHSQVVGYVITWCDNSVTGNGYPTQYYDEEWFDC